MILIIDGVFYQYFRSLIMNIFPEIKDTSFGKTIK